jgi:hypothetical protein
MSGKSWTMAKVQKRLKEELMAPNDVRWRAGNISPMKMKGTLLIPPE